MIRADTLVAIALFAACYRAPASNDTTSTAGRADTTGTASQQPGRADSTSAAAPMITLTTDRRSYRAGDEINLTITNAGEGTYTFNPCTRLVERESAGTWSEVREERICTMIAHVLGPRSTRTERTELGDDLSAGRYRVVVAFVEDLVTPVGQSRSVRAVSAPFAVTR